MNLVEARLKQRFTLRKIDYRFGAVLALKGVHHGFRRR
jgi:hypothetical protein